LKKSKAIWIIVLSLLSVAIFGQAGLLLAQNPAPATLKEISSQKEGSRLQVVIKVDGNFKYEVSELGMPNRLMVDLTSVEKILASPYVQIDDTGVMDIRVGQFQAQVARVVFDLAEKIPAHSVSSIEGGLKVTFWYETEEEKPTPPPPPPVKPAEKEIPKEAIKEPVQEGPSAEGAKRPGFFVQVSGGINIYLSPKLSVRREFELYGETATFDETYNHGSDLAGSVRVGKYFKNFKAGIGFSLMPFGQEGTFQASLPHPLTFNTPRTVNFNAETSALSSTIYNLYAFALYPFLETEKFSLWAGPVLGLSMGKIKTLEDFNFEEKAPFAAADTTITDLTYIEDSFTDIMIGVALDFEYILSKSFSLVADAKLIYINPKIDNLGTRINLFHIQIGAGIQFVF
jgi:hypothetical protein